jgi:branched-chain amino acid transport system ATP-binding protein
LLKNISRLLTGRAGALRFDGLDLTTQPAHAVVELGVIQVPEARRIFPDMTVLENLQLGSYSQRSRADRARNLERVFALFPRLAERRKQLGGTMSGGEQQMLAIGRGLMANPRLLLLDEPSIGLAPVLVKSIFETIVEINRQGITIVLLEQNVYQSLRIAHRAYVMDLGRIVLQGTGAELAENEQVKKTFLGL